MLFNNGFIYSPVCFLSHLLPPYDACLRGAASAKAGGKGGMGVDLLDLSPLT
jgi:hypothetical protein